MQQSSFFIMLVFIMFIIWVNGLVAPIYGPSPLFETNTVQTLIPMPNSTALPLPAFNFPINPVKGLSTQNHRKPFISISGIKTFETDNNRNLLLLSKISYSMTSITIRLVLKIFSPTKILSWVYDSPISFYYMLIDSTFPDTYISALWELDNNVDLSAGQTRTKNVVLNNWIGSNPITLSTTDTRFIHALMSMEISSSTPTNKYSVNLSFSRKSNNQFQIAIKSVYRLKINSMAVSLFIFNQLNMDSYLIKITQNYFVSTVPLSGSSQILQVYNGWGVYPDLQLIVGLGGFEFENNSINGFLLSVDKSVVSSSLTLSVGTTQSPSIAKLQATIFSIQQLKCPNPEPYINTARTECYTTCPSETIPATTFITTTSLTQCQTCVIGTSGCCAFGYYWSTTSSSCYTCPSLCTSCFSATECQYCVSGYFLNASKSCQSCSTGCVLCDSLACSECLPDFDLVAGTCVCQVGTFLNSITLRCQSCSIINDCIACPNSTTCTDCSVGFFVSAGTCAACGSDCQQCDSTGCLKCNSGFFIFQDTASTPSLVCRTCQTAFDPLCITCNQTQCFTCSPNYFYRASVSQCILISSVVCGDGDWVNEIQACDDGNKDANDGCSSQCKVETDYVCLLSDMQESGASFCKYNRDFNLQFSHLQKEATSNIVHLFFKLEPQTFNQWNQQTIEKLLSPMQIVDTKTGDIQIVPVNSLDIIFSKNGDTNEIQVIIDYDSYNLEGTFLQFNMKPAATGLQKINHLQTQNNLYWKIDTQKSGVYLFSYDKETYILQSLIFDISLGVGMMAFFMLILGFFMPIGKLIILQSLAVVQISYFSLFQFKKIPPTYLGLQNLIYSNGYNKNSLFFQQSEQQGFQDVYRLLGLKQEILANINISFILFIVFPVVIALVAYLVSKCFKKADKKQKQIEIKISQNVQSKLPPRISSKLLPKQSNSPLDILNSQRIFQKKTQNNETNNQVVESQVEQGFQVEEILNRNKNIQHDIFRKIVGFVQENYKIKETKVKVKNNKNQKQKQKQVQEKQQKQQNLTLAEIIPRRILYEMTFYGFIVISYLSWISVIHSIQNQKISTYIYLGLFSSLSLLFTIALIKIEPKSVCLNELLKQQEATDKIFPKKHFILTNFGQFSQVYSQLTVKKPTDAFKIFQKFYLIFILERAFTSIMIMMLPKMINFLSIFLILTYGVIFLVMVIIYRKSLNTPDQNLDPLKVDETRQRKASLIADLLRLEIESNATEAIKPQQQKKSQSMFSFLHQNYLLRQSINVFTIFVIQVAYFYANMAMNSGEPAQTFTQDTIITEILPLFVLGLLSLNMIFNVFLWIWQLKCERIFQKSRIIYYCCFPKQFEVELQKMRKILEQKSQTQRQQAQVVKMINNFMQKSVYFQPKENPFLGMQERQKQQANQALLDMFKIPQDKFNVPVQAKKRKNWLVQKYWEHL